jgi:hypothetical protein
MKKFKAFCRSFYKNVIVKKKVRGFFYLFFTKEGRTAVERLWELTKNCTRIEVVTLDYECIQPGHRIIYKKYADYLLKNCREIKIPMIRVVADPTCKGRFIVVDGNHRLPALKERARRSYRVIKCEVMV